MRLLIFLIFPFASFGQWAPARPLGYSETHRQLSDIVSNFNRRAYGSGNYEAPTPPVAAPLPQEYYQRPTTPNSPYKLAESNPRTFPAQFNQYSAPQAPPLYDFNPSTSYGGPNPVNNKYEPPARRPNNLYEAPSPLNFPQGISYYQPPYSGANKPVLLVSSAYISGGEPDYVQPQGSYGSPGYGSYLPPSPPASNSYEATVPPLPPVLPSYDNNQSPPGYSGGPNQPEKSYPPPGKSSYEFPSAPPRGGYLSNPIPILPSQYPDYHRPPPPGYPEYTRTPPPEENGYEIPSPPSPSQPEKPSQPQQPSPGPPPSVPGRPEIPAAPTPGRPPQPNVPEQPETPPSPPNLPGQPQKPGIPVQPPAPQQPPTSPPSFPKQPQIPRIPEQPPVPQQPPISPPGRQPTPPPQQPGFPTSPPSFPGQPQRPSTPVPQQPGLPPSQPSFPGQPQKPPQFPPTVPTQPEFPTERPTPPPNQPSFPGQPQYPPQRPEIPSIPPPGRPPIPGQPEFPPNQPQRPPFIPFRPEQPRFPSPPSPPRQPERPPFVPFRPERPGFPQQTLPPVFPTQPPFRPTAQQFSQPPRTSPNFPPIPTRFPTPSPTNLFPTTITTRSPFIPGSPFVPPGRSTPSPEFPPTFGTVPPFRPNQLRPTPPRPGQPYVPPRPEKPPPTQPPQGPMVPNRIRGKAHVICEENGMDFNVKTIFPFTGQIFAHDRKRNPNCVHSFRNEWNIDIKFSYAECGIKNTGTEKATQTQFHLQIIVMFEQADGTTTVQSFMAQCFQQKINYNKQQVPKRIEEALEELKLIPTKLEQKAPLPTAEMKIVKEIEHHGEGDGDEIDNVNIGQPLRIEWSLKPESDAYGFIVKDCYVEDAIDGTRHQVIDERGCSVDLNILGHPHYDTYHDIARTHWHAFKVPDSSQLSIKCDVQICTDIADSENGLTSCDKIPTPPFCPDLVTSPSNSILFDVEGNLVQKRDIHGQKVFSTHVHTDICFGNSTDTFCNGKAFEKIRQKHFQQEKQTKIDEKICFWRFSLAVINGLSILVLLLAIGLNICLLIRQNRLSANCR